MTRQLAQYLNLFAQYLLFHITRQLARYLFCKQLQCIVIRKAPKNGKQGGGAPGAVSVGTNMDRLAIVFVETLYLFLERFVVETDGADGRHACTPLC